jgi:uncharacterized protein YggE
MLAISNLIIFTMKKYFLLLALFPIFALAQTSEKDNSITVIGISELEIEPDLITLSMSIKETENVKKESDVVTLENKFIKFLSSLQIPKDNFTIDRFYAREQVSLTGSSKFKQSKVYKLIIPSALLLDTIVTKCFELGLENVYVAKIDHSKIDSLKNDLLSKAIQSAKSKAEIIASNMGVNLGKVTMVNESYKLVADRSDLYYDRPFAMEEVVVTGYGSGTSRYNSQRNSSTINLEKLHLSKSVIAKFEIK